MKEITAWAVVTKNGKSVVAIKTTREAARDWKREWNIYGADAKIVKLTGSEVVR